MFKNFQLKSKFRSISINSFESLTQNQLKICNSQVLHTLFTIVNTVKYLYSNDTGDKNIQTTSTNNNKNNEKNSF